MLLRLPRTSIYVGETTRFSLRMRGVSAIAFLFTKNLDVLVFPDTTMQIEINSNYHYREFIYYELYVTVRNELRQAKKQPQGKHESTSKTAIDLENLCAIQKGVERYRRLCGSTQSDDGGIGRHGIKHRILGCWE
jgi:hypothetical protein